MSDQQTGYAGASQETAERAASLSGTIIQDRKEWSGMELGEEAGLLCYEGNFPLTGDVCNERLVVLIDKFAHCR